MIDNDYQVHLSKRNLGSGELVVTESEEEINETARQSVVSCIHDKSTN